MKDARRFAAADDEAARLDNLEARLRSCEKQLVVAFDLLGQNFSQPRRRLSLVHADDGDRS